MSTAFRCTLTFVDARLLVLCRTPSMTLKRHRSLRTYCMTGRVRDVEPVRAGLGGTRACVRQSRSSRRQTFHDSANSHCILGKLLGMLAIGGLSDSIVVRARTASMPCALPGCMWSLSRCCHSCICVSVARHQEALVLLLLAVAWHQEALTNAAVAGSGPAPGGARAAVAGKLASTRIP